MAHERDGIGVEIEVAFAAQQGRVVRLAEDQRLMLLVIGGYGFCSCHSEGLRLAVER